MNEVTTSSVTNHTVIRPTSSKGSVDTGKPEASGNPLPEVKEAAPVEKVITDDTGQESAQNDESQDVNSAVEFINDYVQSIQRDLHFSVDEDLEKTVVKVMDSDSGEVIRQIPEEVVLELARKLNEGGDFQLIDALG